jgi:hypothetical protein
MLVEMVAIAREIAAGELAEREVALITARREMEATIAAMRAAAEALSNCACAARNAALN